MKNQPLNFLLHRVLLFWVLFAFAACQAKVDEVQHSPRFNHVYLKVADMDRSIAFYTSAFDLELVKQIKKLKRTTEDGVSTEYDISLSLLKFPDQHFVLEIGESPDFKAENSAANFTHLGIDVLDIEAASERILKAGGVLSRPLSLVETEDIKAKTMFFTGPDGETIELMQLISGDF
ncbi:catechol 2,3-dioxygenase-like lactoylglutathione lyase family enzyme [Algoriphagus boseongensis]|uniref:Catechol 2,3-dioxygenase-like lactoylglutathione lyase family enzyme n=1 Tax=Algoriphagus boseongensis TaxID=1442587 RepID=A0A4R6T740_9BACT|nr:VOC family protein [Algoriphagus boseongensis]TDQ17025.1 catechol 2,3-dioxygenase-like lactoylglutathione lyase family enzyme [Algoriphagus boseongensis]